MIKHILTLVVGFIGLVYGFSQNNDHPLLKPLSTDQTFFTHDKAKIGDYVGIIKAFPEYEYRGEPATFRLMGNSPYFNVSSEGLITVKSFQNITEGKIAINIEVNKANYKPTVITATINIISNKKCIYVDFSQSSDGDGTIDAPRNRFIPLSNKYFFFKRDTKYIGGPILLKDIDNITLESYGTGSPAKLICNEVGAARVLTIYNGCENVMISNIDLTFQTYNYLNPDEVGNNCLYLPQNAGKDITIQYAELYNARGGISSSASLGTFNVIFCNIHHIATDGIFLASPGVSTNNIIGTYIYDVNEFYYLNTSEKVSHGDNIQNDQSDTRLINCLFDHSSTGNKFCVISGSNDIYIKDCMFINHPDRIGFYSIKNSGTVEGCTFIGGKNGIWAHSGQNLKVHYNIFINQENSAVNNQGANKIEFFNNTTYNCGKVANGGAFLLRNNIFYISAGQVIYESPNIDSDFNLINKEYLNIFGTGKSKIKMLNTGNERNSIAADPLFENPEEFNFRIQPDSSPALRAGIDLNLKSDFEGLQIGHYPNLGAFEYSSEYSPIVKKEPFFDVYPNPTTGTLNLKSEQSTFVDLTLNIFNYSGMLVWQSTSKKINPKELTFDITPLPQANYILKIIVNSELRQTDKIVLLN